MLCEKDNLCYGINPSKGIFFLQELSKGLTSGVNTRSDGCAKPYIPSRV